MSAKKKPGEDKAAIRDHEEQIFETGAGLDIEELYTPDNLEEPDYDKLLGQPGEFPFTRGPYPGMYRTRIWTRRFQIGFGSPQES
ncbi:MAG: methylmalonyl-CoA mutase family protein, partial [Gammaproteobacteria bacterium]